MRQGLLWLSERQGIFNFVRRNGWPASSPPGSSPARRSRRASQAARELARRGITASLDLLGESVTAEAEAAAARDQYLDDARPDGGERGRGQRLGQAHPDGPRHRRGALPGATWCASSTRRGRSAGSSGSTWRARTTPSARWTSSTSGSFRAYGAHCGVVIQSMLRRSERRHRGPDRAAGAGPALQGRLPRAAGGGLSRQGRRGPQLRAR